MTETESKKDYPTIAKALCESLNLRQSPVAIAFTDSITQGVSEFAGRVPAGCRFWQDAAGSTFATSAKDHELCAVGVYTHNLQSSPSQHADLQDALKVFGDLGYVTDRDLALIPVLQSQSKYVIYSPLAETPLSPDVVLMFVNANQTLILSEATQQVENDNPPAMGRPACGVVAQVMNTRRAALSSGCCGARAYLDAFDDSTAIFAIPGAKLQAYTCRIEALAKANAMLATFHQIRRRAIVSGQTPTIKESLAVLQASN